MGWMALLDDNNNEIGVVGDEPWDMIGAAMDELINVYKTKYGRLPNAVELEQILNFTRPEELRNLTYKVEP